MNVCVVYDHVITIRYISFLCPSCRRIPTNALPKLLPPFPPPFQVPSGSKGRVEAIHSPLSSLLFVSLNDVTDPPPTAIINYLDRALTPTS